MDCSPETSTVYRVHTHKHASGLFSQGSISLRREQSQAAQAEFTLGRGSRCHMVEMPHGGSISQGSSSTGRVDCDRLCLFWC